MLGFMDRDQLRRWIAEAGLVCMGISSLCAAGCVGAARDSLAAKVGSSKTDDQQVAADETPGRASLSDNRPESKPRRPGNQQLARRTRPRPAPRDVDPFLNDAPNRQVASRNVPPRNPVADEAIARQIAARRAAAQAQSTQGQVQTVQAQAPAGPGRAQAFPPVQTASRNTTDRQRSAAGVNDRAAVSQVGATTRINQRPLAQAAAKRPVEARRAKAPVITPSLPDSDSLAGATIDNGYERQRADRLMARAHDMLSHNFREEALRLASVAYELEKSKQALYQAGEERPSEFINRLQPNSLIPDTETGTRVEQASQTVKRPAPRPRSRPATPVALGQKRSRAELTDIRAGWQNSPETEKSPSSDAEPAPALPNMESAKPLFEADTSDSGAKSAANSGHAEVALLAAPRSADSGVTTADAIGPTLTPAHEETPGGGPSLAMMEAPAVPEVLISTRSPGNDSGLDVPNDVIEAEPIIDEHAASQSKWSAMSIGGLAAGFLGLVGLVYWRRQEQKHYAAAGR